MTKDYFEQRKSRVNSAISNALGPQLAAAYLIHPDGARPSTRFGLRLEPHAIAFSADGRTGAQATKEPIRPPDARD
jgi:hypothetical protein